MLCTQVFLNAALEVFVCSSSIEEAEYRAQFLQCVSRILQHPKFHNIFSTWVKVLNKVISHLFSVSLKFQGDLFNIYFSTSMYSNVSTQELSSVTCIHM